MFNLNKIILNKIIILNKRRVSKRIILTKIILNKRRVSKRIIVHTRIMSKTITTISFLRGIRSSWWSSIRLRGLLRRRISRTMGSWRRSC